ncbi:MAG: hypothetical protein WBA72_06435 [Ornithinimicrobium sp.]
MRTALTSLALAVMTALSTTACTALPFVAPFETLDIDDVTLVVERNTPAGVTDILHTGPIVVTNGCLGIGVFGGREDSWVRGDVEPTDTQMVLPMVAPKGTTVSREADRLVVTTAGGEVYRMGDIASFSSVTRVAKTGDDEGNILEEACGTRTYIYLTQW